MEKRQNCDDAAIRQKQFPYYVVYYVIIQMKPKVCHGLQQLKALKEPLNSTPKLLIQFFKLLLSPEERHTSLLIQQNVSRNLLLIDLIFGITKGKFLT